MLLPLVYIFLWIALLCRSAAQPLDQQNEAGNGRQEERAVGTGQERMSVGTEGGPEGIGQAAGGPGDGELSEGGTEGGGTEGVGNSLQLNAGGDMVENEPNIDLEDSEVRLKKSIKQDGAGGDADKSKTSPEDGQSLSQASILPSLPAAVEFAVQPAATENGYIVSSNLHINSQYARSRNADKQISAIHEINEFNRLTESQGVTRQGIYKLKETEFNRANNSDVEAHLGNSFANLPPVYCNGQSTFIKISDPAAFAGISGVTGNQQVIIEVMGSLPYLIYYNPFDQQIWLCFSARFSDFNEEFWQTFILEDFHPLIKLILESLIDEVNGPFLLLDQTTFLYLMVLLRIFSTSVYGGIHLFDAFVRPLVFESRLNTGMKKSEEYRKPPSARIVQTEDAAASPLSQNGSNQRRNLNRNEKIDLTGKLYINDFHLERIKKQLDRREEHAKSGAHPKTAIQTEKSKKQRKNPGHHGNTVSTPQLPPAANGSNQLDIAQHTLAEVPSGDGVDPEVSLSIRQPEIDKDQDMTSRGARPKTVRAMTQSKPGEREPPSGGKL